MTPTELRDFCLALPQAVETFPFGDVISVFKCSGSGKIFAMSSLGGATLSVSLKCDPEDSVALRSDFSKISPGYHLNKKHWITIIVDDLPAGDSVPDDLVEQLIRESHRLVAPKIRPAKSAQPQKSAHPQKPAQP